jgi:hypothetical protein
LVLNILYSLGEYQGVWEAEQDKKGDGAEMDSCHPWVHLLVLDLTQWDLDHSLMGLDGWEGEAGETEDLLVEEM